MNIIQEKRLTLTVITAVALLVALPLNAQSGGTVDCRSLIGPLASVQGGTVGPDECWMSETTVRNADGVIFQRLEMGVSGTIDGYTVKQGERVEIFTDAPEFALAQRSNLGPYYHGTGYYRAPKGSGMTVLLPQSAADWNGKLFVLAHGSSHYTPIGELPPRQGDQYPLLTGANAYAGLMIDQGYAVAYTRRPASGARRRGAISRASEEVRLDDGTLFEDKTFGFHSGLIRDWTQIAKNLVQTRLGRRPEHTYFYGKSGGGSLGRIFNYKPGANRDTEGNRLYDGMLIDDAGGGWYWPVQLFARTDISEGVFSLQPDSRDTLIVDEVYKQNFAFQIDIAHQNYTGADFVEGHYLFVKRENARFLKEKGLAFKNRMYEIVGVSHADAGYASRSEGATRPGLNNLDLGGVFDALIVALDQWVEKGVEPSPTRSGSPLLGDVDGDGSIENSAVELPEVACPIGVFIEYAEAAPRPGRTTFVPYLRQPRHIINADAEDLPAGFDPEWLEPLDARGYMVDMNQNGARDTRESITQAWQRRMREGERYGTLASRETLTHAHYVECVSRVTGDLVKENLLSEMARTYYLRNAHKSDIGMSARDLSMAVPPTGTTSGQ
ncbi:MAG: alpha/beta hydrolase domain-containing protein [Acidobacteriota bacterium]|nr:alpha/beta hydrolase domain-containing protein [Acidobacteriota bacterium]